MFGYPSYTHISSSDLATSKEALHICIILSVIHSRKYKFMVSWAWKDDSLCNTTVPSDSGHPATHLGTLSTLISPLPTLLHPKGHAYMQNWECNPPKWTNNVWSPGHEKMIVTAILLFIWIVGIQPHIWVPFLHSYLLILLGYIQRGLALMQNCEWNPPKWTTNYGVLGMKRW